jgi:hypothetical protein
VGAAAVNDLAIIVPSRGRPNNIDRLRNAFLATSSNVDLIVAVDDDDPHLPGYREVWAAHDRAFSLGVGPRLRLVGTLNVTALAVEHRYVGFMGDDHLPRTKGWDLRYLESLEAAGPGGMVFGNDMIQGPNLPTHIVMDRRIIDCLGYMAPPGLTHLYVDNFWFDLGHELGTLRYLPDVIVEHLHPVAGNAEWDPTYSEANSEQQYTTDEAAFRTYRDTQFHQDVSRLREVLR